jgi:hypothetical protein
MPLREPTRTLDLDYVNNRAIRVLTSEPLYVAKRLFCRGTLGRRPAGAAARLLVSRS